MQHQFTETLEFMTTLIAQEFILVNVIVIEEAFALVRTVWTISEWFECFVALSVLSNSQLLLNFSLQKLQLNFPGL